MKLSQLTEHVTKAIALLIYACACVKASPVPQSFSPVFSTFSVSVGPPPIDTISPTNVPVITAYGIGGVTQPAGFQFIPITANGINYAFTTAGTTYILQVVTRAEAGSATITTDGAASVVNVTATRTLGYGYELSPTGMNIALVDLGRNLSLNGGVNCAVNGGTASCRVLLYDGTATSPTPTQAYTGVILGQQTLYIAQRVPTSIPLFYTTQVDVSDPQPTTPVPNANTALQGQMVSAISRVKADGSTLRTASAGDLTSYLSAQRSSIAATRSSASTVASTASSTSSTSLSVTTTITLAKPTLPTTTTSPRMGTVGGATTTLVISIT